jgi:copper chaperone CopZ
MVTFTLLSLTACSTQIQNAKTEKVKIYGNCGMCEKTIENAGSVDKFASVDWDKNTKMATLTYDAKKTNKEEIIKRIALAGYDSDSFLAPDDVYNNLPGCCQYDRDAKSKVVENKTMEDHSMHESHNETEEEKVVEVVQEKNQLTKVFNYYFMLKDALVKSDGAVASSKAKGLIAALNAVQMNLLSNEEHMVWMKVMKDLKFDAEHIEETKDVKHQRDHFITLSENIYQLNKVSKLESPTYYQRCPMANDGNGATWLSKEEQVKNPYYGSMMLSCGKVIETIK